MSIIQEILSGEELSNVEAQMKKLMTIMTSWGGMSESLLRTDTSVVPETQDVLNIRDLVREEYRRFIEKESTEHFVEIIGAAKPFLLSWATDIDGTVDIDNLITTVMINDLSEYGKRVDDLIEQEFEGSPVDLALGGLQLDKRDSLVLVDDRYLLLPQGIIYADNWWISYHQFLRRYFGANFTEITTLAARLYAKGNVELRLAIDPYRIAGKHRYRDVIEKDYWWGKKFSQEELDKPSKPKVTVYKRTDRDLDISWAVDRIEVLTQDLDLDRKEIEIEEVNPSPENMDMWAERSLGYSKKYRLGKYVHMIWNRKSQVIEHFDLAVRIYPLSIFPKRFDSTWLPKDFPTLKKMKLLRFDGPMKMEDVIEIISDFFRYDELIGEFFSGI